MEGSIFNDLKASNVSIVSNSNLHFGGVLNNVRTRTTLVLLLLLLLPNTHIHTQCMCLCG